MAQGSGVGPRVTAVCVYRPGKGFTDEYVLRRKAQIAEHCKAPHDFVCITNSKLPGVNTLPLTNKWQGFWCTLELFKYDWDGTVVYEDLDTMTIDDVTDIYTYPHDFTIATDWRPAEKNTGRFHSSFMAWDGLQDLKYLHDEFLPHLIPQYSQSMERWGDQGWIQDRLRRPVDSLQKLFPDRYVHYKTHVTGWTRGNIGHVPAGASIVAFSGNPRPHEINWSLPLGNRDE
jgi:hypothetical protein